MYYFIPTNQDDYISHLTFACGGNTNFIHTQYEGCSNFEINTWNIKRFWPYDIIGSTTGFLIKFVPLKDLEMKHYVLNLIEIAIILLGLKLLNKEMNFEKVIIVLLFFPLMYLTINNTGPANVSIIAMIFSMVILCYGRIEVRHIILKNIAISFMWVIALEEKIYFIYAIPVIIIFSIIETKKIMNVLKSCAAPIILIISLFLSTTINGTPLVMYLANKNISNIWNLFRVDLIQRNLLNAFSWPFLSLRNINNYFEQTILDLDTSKISLLDISFPLMGILILIAYYQIFIKYLKIPELGLLMFTFILIIISGGWAVHHIYLLNVLIIVYIIKYQKSTKLNQLIFLSINFVTVILILLSPSKIYSSKNLGSVYNFIDNRSDKSVFVIDAWGIYFKAKYLYPEHDFYQVVSFRDFSSIYQEYSGKKIETYFVCTECTYSLENNKYGRLQIDPVVNNQGWNIYKIS
jgi:hypothetical protein